MTDNSDSPCSNECILEEQDVGESTCLLTQADAGGQECRKRASSFSQIVVMVPSDISPFCLSLLWTLKDKGLVLDWHWEDGNIRIWVDTDLVLMRTSVPEGSAKSLLLRLIQAAQYRDHFPCQDADDLATDFAFLDGDLQQTLLPLA